VEATEASIEGPFYRPGLVMELERRADPADLAARSLLRPYFACRFGFVLAAVG